MTSRDIRVVYLLIQAWEQLNLTDHFFGDGNLSGWCVNSGRIGLDVLDKLNVAANVAVWDVIVGNDAGEQYLTNEIPVAEWPDHAWTVGVHQSQAATPGHISGHVVIEVAGGVLDLSAPQFTRPKYGMNCPGPLFLDSSFRIEGEADSGFYVKAEGGTFYVLRNRAKRLPPELDAAPGFAIGRHTNLVNQLVTCIREQARKSPRSQFTEAP